MEQERSPEQGGAAGVALAQMPETASKLNEMPNPVVMAIGHLRMISLAATGEYKPRRKGEIEDREKAILAYLRTGQLIATAEDAELLARLKELFADAVISEKVTA